MKTDCEKIATLGCKNGKADFMTPKMKECDPRVILARFELQVHVGFMIISARLLIIEVDYHKPYLKLHIFDFIF